MERKEVFLIHFVEQGHQILIGEEHCITHTGQALYNSELYTGGDYYQNNTASN